MRKVMGLETGDNISKSKRKLDATQYRLLSAVVRMMLVIEKSNQCQNCNQILGKEL